MTSGSEPIVRHNVVRNNSPEATTSAIEMTYMAKTTNPACSGKNVCASITYTVKRAEQDVNGTSSAVNLRCSGVAKTRVAEIAGTLQPKPTISGMNALPGNPIARMSRSATTAARAM